MWRNVKTQMVLRVCAIGLAEKRAIPVDILGKF
jgi:hypothetical protein